VDVSAIAEASERWRAHGLKDYLIEQKRLCFCALPRGFVRLTVRGNKIVAGVDVTTTQPVPPQALQSYQTVDEMFAWLRDVQSRNPARLTIDFDARYGYPERIVLDYSVGLADDELSLEQRSLERLISASASITMDHMREVPARLLIDRVRGQPRPVSASAMSRDSVR
jgi:hypothetical protein